jgi:hypothetical protein
VTRARRSRRGPTTRRRDRRPTRRTHHRARVRYVAR